MTHQTFQYSSHSQHKKLSIVARDINVIYQTPSSSPEEILRANGRQRLVGKLLGRDPNVYVQAVKNVSFMAYQGDSIGFLGINGAGKSSLLRVVSGNESPKSGQVFAKSQPSMLGVSAVLMPDLSGYDNARLGCLALGLSPEETQRKLPEIAKFTSIGDAMYRRMRSYSSGMGARLRFAISTVSDPDILIIDEALSTGDATFQERSQQRMQSMLDHAGTILLVSHSATQVEELCNRAIWMHHGEIIADGDVAEIVEYYRLWAGLLRTNRPKADQYMKEVHSEYHPLSIELFNMSQLARLVPSDL